MKIGSVDLSPNSNKIFLIAEVGNNHEGSVVLAEELIGLAKEAGADAVKFQTFKTEHYVSNKDEARFKRLKSFELSPADFERLARVAKETGIQFISTPFDLYSVDCLEPLVSCYKIASGDNNFFPLLEKVAKKRKPILLSGGLANIEELRKSKQFIETIWKEIGASENLALLHCVTSYPVPDEQANIRAIEDLRENFDCMIGYSDHTLGIDACLAAAALGARVVEKHFTKDKNFSDFRDHQLSSDPQELKELVVRLKRLSALLGGGKKVIQECEKPLLPMLRRSVVASRDLPQGHVVTSEDITWVRPSGGISPGEETKLFGKKTSRSVKLGEFLTLEEVL